MSDDTEVKLSNSAKHTMNPALAVANDYAVEKGLGDVSNIDDARLEQMGYKAELNRGFSMWSALAVGFSISNSWFGVSGSLAVGIANGGPAIYIWGDLLMALISFCVACSLGELASAYPVAQGQSYWVAQLAPKRLARFASYVTGNLAWAGATVTGASVALVIGQGVVGLIILNNPDIVYQPWQGFVAYQISNFLVFFLNCHAKLLPGLSTASLYTSLISMVVITITVLAASPAKQGADFVFASFVNDSGWDSPFICFMTGILGVNWGFSCLDAVAHVSEELPRPEVNVPKAMLGTVFIGLATSFIYDIAIFFCVQNLNDVIATPTYVPILELFRQTVRGNIGGAIFMEILVIATATGCLAAIHLWESRLLWSFARDEGFMLSKWLSRVAPDPIGVPLWAHVFSCVAIALLGLLYLASSTAFNSLVTGCIIFQYLSYSIPVCFLMLKGRNIKPGPFWLGKWGWLCNIVLLVWSLLTLVFYSFPFIMPATAGNMNYVTVIIAIFMVYVFAYWFIRGRKYFRVASEALE